MSEPLWDFLRVKDQRWKKWNKIDNKNKIKSPKTHGQKTPTLPLKRKASHKLHGLAQHNHTPQ